KTLHQDYQYNQFLLDEVHFYRDFDATLKKVYDFLQVEVIFTSSVSLAMFESSYDLSRRVKLLSLHEFSFGEYLYFKRDVQLTSLTIEDIIQKQWTSQHLEYASYFKDYLTGGLMPFALDDPEVLPLLENILEKILNKDIPSVGRVTLDEVGLMIPGTLCSCKEKQDVYYHRFFYSGGNSIYFCNVEGN
ncbi:MAG: AAA family ATPase, partial [Candidatus Auribacterota bacterium]|nr:AAA family ATPase [Candidatus Auribacterota bacterium]